MVGVHTNVSVKKEYKEIKMTFLSGWSKVVGDRIHYMTGRILFENY